MLSGFITRYTESLFPHAENFLQLDLDGKSDVHCLSTVPRVERGGILDMRPDYGHVERESAKRDSHPGDVTHVTRYDTADTIWIRGFEAHRRLSWRETGPIGGSRRGLIDYSYSNIATVSHPVFPPKWILIVSSLLKLAESSQFPDFSEARYSQCAYLTLVAPDAASDLTSARREYLNLNSFRVRRANLWPGNKATWAHEKNSQ